MGTQNVTNVNHSVVGAVATGDNARAEGTVTAPQPLTQSEYDAILRKAQGDLNEQDAIERIDSVLYEGMTTLLRHLRHVQIEQGDITTQLSQMKATLDELAAHSHAPDLRGRLRAHGLKAVEAFGMHVVTGLIAEWLLKP